MPQQLHERKYVNTVVQAGRIMGDPEIGETNKGIPFLKFTLWNESNEMPGRHQASHRVIIFGKVAEKFRDKKKGDWIKVFGCLQFVTDKDKNVNLEIKAYGAEDI